MGNENMSPNDARDRADRIIAMLTSGDDPEVARGQQEEFCVDVLRVVADRSILDRVGYAAQLAREALRVVDTPGHRW